MAFGLGRAGGATVRLAVDDAAFNRDLARDSANFRRATSGMTGDLGKLSRGALAGSGVFRGFARSIAFASTAFLGGAGLAAAIRGAFGELAAAERATARTNAVLESTGMIAGVTAKHVDDLAAAILRKTGIDDEATKAAENMLLTFTNVRNVVGKNNDIFDQATQAVADMATAMNEGAIPSAEQLQQTSIQVGKALQDPIKGVTALRRVGVALTVEQQEQIKTLVQSGRTMEAQKIILRELSREFGGAAKAAGSTFSGQVAKLRETLLNMSATIAKGVQPSLQGLTTRLQAWLDNTENQKRVQEDANKVIKAAGTFIGALPVLRVM